MGFLTRLFERKASPDAVMRDLMRANQSSAGAYVSPDTAMNVAAVYSAVRVISETVGSLPLHIYKREKQGRTVAYDHPLYSLLHDSPNEYQTAMEFREMMQAALCLRGNAFAYINWISDSRATELLPLSPERVTVRVAKDGTRTYELANNGASPTVLPASDVLHIRGLSSDGVLGRSVLADARESIGVALATQEYAGRFYKNDATPSVVLKHPQKLTKDTAERLRDSWDKMQGGGNVRSTAVLEEGMTIDRLSLSAEDSQFLDTRKFQRSEIAGIFRVPAHMIGDLERATFGNIEHQSIEFVTHCIRPWLVRWEQALSKALFTAPGLYYPEHNVEGLLRGDIKSRYDAYAIGRNWGWLSANDIRERENLNQIPDGDVYLQPLNMNAAGSPQVVTNG